MQNHLHPTRAMGTMKTTQSHWTMEVCRNFPRCLGGGGDKTLQLPFFSKLICRFDKWHATKTNFCGWHRKLFTSQRTVVIYSLLVLVIRILHRYLKRKNDYFHGMPFWVVTASVASNPFALLILATPHHCQYPSFTQAYTYMGNSSLCYKQCLLWAPQLVVLPVAAV